MAAIKKRGAAVVVRRGGGMTAAKAKELAREAGRRARQSAVRAAQKGTVLSLGGAAALAVAEQRGVALPTLGGIDPAVLYGAALAFGAPMALKGKSGAALASVGEGVLCVGLHRSIVRGSVKVEGDDDFGY